MFGEDLSTRQDQDHLSTPPQSVNARPYHPKELRDSLPKSGPLDLATKYSFPLFFVGGEALLGIY